MNNYIESFTLPYLTCKVGYPYDILYEQFFLGTPNSDRNYVWDEDKWIFSAVSAFSDGRSNGEKAFDYFQDNINMDSVTLLDEPENSLAPKLQKQLADMILNYSRFFNCQFIIATHSPFYSVYSWIPHL